MKKFVYLLAFTFALGTAPVIAGNTSAEVVVECEKCGDKDKKCDGEKKACCAKKAEAGKACSAKSSAEKEKCHSKKGEAKAEVKEDSK